jgi:hypothetical protein
MRYSDITEAPLRLVLSGGKMTTVPMDNRHDDEDAPTTIKLRGFKAPARDTGSIDGFLAAVNDATYPNPLDDRQRVFDGAVAEFNRFGSGVTLKDIRSINPGGGRAALRIICDLADEYGVTIDLYAKGYAHTSTEKLVDLYSSFGFVEDNDDFEEEGQVMVRRPH